MTIFKLLTEMEHQLDRSLLFQDPPSKGQFEVMVARWIAELRVAERTVDDRYEEGVYDGRKECDSEIAELREALAFLDEKIRQIKEML